VQVAHLLAVGFGEGATNPPQHLLTPKTKNCQRFGSFSVKSGNPKSTGDIAFSNRLSVPVL